MELIWKPLFNILILFYKTFGDFGLAIIVLTVIIKLILVPLTTPSLKAARKMAEMAPELEKLKKKYKDDKQKFTQAQFELYRQKGVNPVAGCLPQIVQFVILIALLNAFSQVFPQNGSVTLEKINHFLYPVLQFAEGTKLNFSFLGLINLSKPDVFHFSGFPPLPGFLLIFSALSQFISSKMMVPQVQAVKKEAAQTEGKTDDLAVSMQSQMLYLFPIMTIFIGFSFPSGLVLYWLIFSLASIIQQYKISGWGGLEPWILKIKK